jgi:hypothetical protein
LASDTWARSRSHRCKAPRPGRFLIRRGA